MLHVDHLFMRTINKLAFTAVGVKVVFDVVFQRDVLALKGFFQMYNSKISTSSKLKHNIISFLSLLVLIIRVRL